MAIICSRARLTLPRIRVSPNRSGNLTGRKQVLIVMEDRFQTSSKLRYSTLVKAIVSIEAPSKLTQIAINNSNKVVLLLHKSKWKIDRFLAILNLAPTANTTVKSGAGLVR